MNDTLNEFATNRTIRLAFAAVLVILALFLLVLTIGGLKALGHDTTPAANTITVQGTGKATAIPDIAQIDFTVMESAATVADAQTAATAKSNAALAALAKDGVADSDVQTTSYNVSPQYQSEVAPCPPGLMCPQIISNGNQKIIGYQVSESIEVKVRDTSKAGTVLQDLGTLGVQNISGPNFVVDNDESVTNQAQAAAIADAKQQAQALANELGVHLGDVVSFSDNGGGYPYPVAYAKGAVMSADSASVPPTLPTGQQETSVTVSVTYEIQ